MIANPTPRRRRNRPCVVCGEPVTRRHPSRGAPKTCSDECAQKAMRRKRGRRPAQPAPDLQSSLGLFWKDRNRPERGDRKLSSWSLMDSHGVVLFYVTANPRSTMRQAAEALGLTQRRVAQIIADLIEADLLGVTKVGTRNSYTVNRQASFRHPTLSHVTLGQFEDLLLSEPEAASSTPGGR